jgi:hypothetical protein
MKYTIICDAIKIKKKKGLPVLKLQLLACEII